MILSEFMLSTLTGRRLRNLRAWHSQNPVLWCILPLNMEAPFLTITVNFKSPLFSTWDQKLLLTMRCWLCCFTCSVNIPGGNCSPKMMLHFQIPNWLGRWPFQQYPIFPPPPAPFYSCMHTGRQTESNSVFLLNMLRTHKQSCRLPTTVSRCCWNRLKDRSRPGKFWESALSSVLAIFQ